MKRIQNLIIALIFFNILSVFSQEENTVSPDAKKDIDNFLNLNICIENKDLSFDFFKKNIKNSNVRSEKYFWFKSKKIQLEQVGSLGSNFITAGIHNDTVYTVYIELNSEISKLLNELAQKDIEIKKGLEKNWFLKDNYSIDEVKSINYVYRFESNKVKEKILKQVHDYFQNYNNIEIPNDLKESYDLLMNPVIFYDYGVDKCYANKIEPTGRKAINQLFKNNRIDLIKNVLRSPNTEARIYALEVLFFSRNMNKYDAEVMNKIEKLPFMISVCKDCFVDLKTNMEIIKSLKK